MSGLSRPHVWSLKTANILKKICPPETHKILKNQSLMRDRPPLYPPFWRWVQLICIFWDGSNTLKVSAKRSKMEIKLGKFVIWEVDVRKNEVVLGVNGVAMDRHGLILGEMKPRAPGRFLPLLSQSKYLLDLRGAIFL